MSRTSLFLATIILGTCTVSLAAPNNRDQQVIDDRDKHQKIDHWIYNDLASAKETAEKTGKPMMVVFRCIP